MRKPESCCGISLNSAASREGAVQDLGISKTERECAGHQSGIQKFAASRI